MCKAAMLDVNCADGARSVSVYTGYNDNGGNPINMCVRIVLDYYNDPGIPGRSCYPCALHRQ